MKRLMSILAVCAVITVNGSAQQAPASGRGAAPPVGAKELLAQAIAAMGGEARLTGITSLTLESIGHTWALEQSERPEGPWLSNYQQRTEVRDCEHHQRSLQTQVRNWNSPQWSAPSTIIVADGHAARTAGDRWGVGSPSDVTNFDEACALGAERLLFTARGAADLHRLPDETQQKVRQDVLGFTWNGLKLRLFLNGWTHLPTMLEVQQTGGIWGPIWGDTIERRWFSFWTLERGGLFYPRQTTVEWNGFPYSDFTVQGLTVDAPLDAAKFAIPAETRAAWEAQAAKVPPVPPSIVNIDDTKAIVLADWLVQLPGGFNVALVRQPDGLVVIEATTTSAYARGILAAIERRFPGVKIKAVVSTSDAWPHVGGIREYVARGIPIYPLDLNVSILTRIIESKHTLQPDTLSATPKAPIFHPVSTRTVIGTGETRIELIPVRGETGERMMVAWLPGAHVLYSSDLIQRARPSGFFMPEMLAEVEAVVGREHLEGVERVFGMHLAPTPWTEVTAAIAAAKK